MQDPLNTLFVRRILCAPFQNGSCELLIWIKTPATAGSGCAPLITAVVTRLLGDAKLAIPSTVPTSEWRSGRARVVYHAGPAAPRARRVHEEGGRPLSSGRPNRSCSDRLAAFWEVSPSAGKSIIQVCTSTVHRRVGLPPEREAAGRKPRHQIRNQCSRPHTKLRNEMMGISRCPPRS